MSCCLWNGEPWFEITLSGGYPVVIGIKFHLGLISPSLLPLAPRIWKFTFGYNNTTGPLHTMMASSACFLPIAVVEGKQHIRKK